MGERLDDPKFWDIFAAAEALDVPIYLHPNSPPRDMIQPYLEKGLDGAVFGFQAETGLHMLRIIVSGAFDEFPKLKFGIGHCGEALPFWLYRIDYMHTAATRANRHRTCASSSVRPGEYLRENVYVTNSGVAWEPAIMLCHQVMGPGSHALRDGLSVPVPAVRSDRVRQPADVGGRQEEVLPDQRRKALQDSE
jgi:2,3-dihydroxybenzoate decarboxylase